MGWWSTTALRETIAVNIESRKGKGFVVVGDDGHQRHVWVEGRNWVYATAADAEVVRAAIKSKTMKALIFKLGELGEACE
jgi:hypothetical protein